MKIYILFDNEDYECPTVHGYFSSIEKAEEAKKLLIIKVNVDSKLNYERFKKWAEEGEQYWIDFLKRHSKDKEYDGSKLHINEAELDVLE